MTLKAPRPRTLYATIESALLLLPERRGQMPSIDDVNLVEAYVHNHLAQAFTVARLAAGDDEVQLGRLSALWRMVIGEE